jgi:hypothetical protein
MYATTFLGRRETTMDENKGGCRTISVPEAGQIYFGLSRNGSYDAAARGEIPTIKIGRKFRVPVAAMEKKIGRVIDAA